MTSKIKTTTKKSTKKASARKSPTPKLGEFLPWIAGAVVIIALAVAIWWGVQRLYPDNSVKHDPVLATVGSPTAGATIDVFEDFLCPACGQFEGLYGEQITKAVDAGSLRVNFHLLNFLDQSSSSKTYSSRAAGAALSVYLKAPERFLAFHTRLFDSQVQPKEAGGKDLSSDELAQIAEQVGAGAAAEDIRGEKDLPAARTAARAASRMLGKVGANGTPSIVKDGKLVNFSGDPQWLQKIIGEPAAPAAPK